jgi:hypothetical protein
MSGAGVGGEGLGVGERSPGVGKMELGGAIRVLVAEARHLLSALDALTFLAYSTQASSR